MLLDVGLQGRNVRPGVDKAYDEGGYAGKLAGPDARSDVGVQDD